MQMTGLGGLFVFNEVIKILFYPQSLSSRLVLNPHTVNDEFLILLLRSPEYCDYRLMLEIQPRASHRPGEHCAS